MAEWLIPQTDCEGCGEPQTTQQEYAKTKRLKVRSVSVGFIPVYVCDNCRDHLNTKLNAYLKHARNQTSESS